MLHTKVYNIWNDSSYLQPMTDSEMRMFYTWDFIDKEIFMTSKMFYFMVPPVT